MSPVVAAGQRPLAVRTLLQSGLRRAEAPSPTLMPVAPRKSRKNLTATAATACTETPAQGNLEFHGSNVAPMYIGKP